MNAQRFDNILATLGRSSSRRRIFAALGGLVARDGATAAAGRKRKHHRKPQETCRPGMKVGSAIVPATGASAKTPVLRKGQRYRLRATGIWQTNATTGNDAVAAYPFDDPFAPIFSVDGVRLGLSIDGHSPDKWGNYVSTHIYEIEVTGHGRPLSLHYTDPVTSDNSLNVAVEVFCAGSKTGSSRTGGADEAVRAQGTDSGTAGHAAGRRR